MEIQGLIRDAYIWVAVPILGLIAIAAAASGRMKALGMTALVLVVSAGFVFIPRGTVESIGQWAGRALQSLVGG